MPALTDTERRRLLQIADDSIAHGLHNNAAAPLDTVNLSTTLRTPGASFVTLKYANRLRGCIGSLEAHRPLAEDVHHNAYAAAFEDPRFPPLAQEEMKEITLSIALLSAPEAMNAATEQALFDQLRPGIDGLILEEGHHRSTFLPAVWEMLPEPREFMRQLKLKARLPAGYWSATLKIYRYSTEVIGAG